MAVILSIFTEYVFMCDMINVCWHSNTHLKIKKILYVSYKLINNTLNI